ncbi:MAG: DUF1707 domain-containing protein [Gemmatimonadaceae bacterium]
MTDSPLLPSTSVAAPAPGASVSSKARERVVELLQVRFANGDLDMDEFERRVTASYQAKTPQELDSLIGDLVQSHSELAVPEYGRIAAILSNNEQNGVIPVPRQLTIVSVFGNVELDISAATFSPSLTEIEISAVFANVALTVPLGVRVESAGNTFLGNFDCKVPHVPGYPNSEEQVIRITGRSIFASVEIRAAPARLASMPASPAVLPARSDARTDSRTDARTDDAPRRLT